MPFAQPPTAAMLDPGHLRSAARNARKKLSQRGLLAGDDSPADHAQLERWAAEMAQKMDHPEPVLMPRDLRKLRHLVPWLDGGDRTERALLDRVVRHLVATSQRVPLRTAAVIAEFHPLERSGLRFRNRRKETLPRVLETGLTPAEIVVRMAADVLRAGTPLSNTLSLHRLNPGSDYSRQLLSALTSPKMAPWLWSHSWEDLERTLEVQAHGPVAVRVVNALLTSVEAGIRLPLDIGSDTAIGRLIQRLHPFLPKNERSPAWSELGQRPRVLLQWWRVQRDLDEAFEAWRAEPERKRFWYRYVGSISSVTAFERIATIVIQLGDYWFVEVGRTGFATYVYEPDSGQALLRMCRRAGREDRVRAYQQGRVDRMIHREGWQFRFDLDIRHLTGREPDR